MSVIVQFARVTVSQPDAEGDSELQAAVMLLNPGPHTYDTVTMELRAHDGQGATLVTDQQVHRQMEVKDKIHFSTSAWVHLGDRRIHAADCWLDLRRSEHITVPATLSR